tara:strand:- start:919 stop:1278 length:360 start_codon:yes stop_codon:yes gene_type:complete
MSSGFMIGILAIYNLLKEKKYTILSIIDAKTMVKNNSEEKNYFKIILDVRSKEEYNKGHYIGAINIPYDTIMEDKVKDLESPILVYCRSGRRAIIAAEKLYSLGIRKIYVINQSYHKLR